MTEEEIRALSNVDLLNLYEHTVNRTELDLSKAEILRRMDTGTGHTDRVPMHPDEYRR